MGAVTFSQPSHQQHMLSQAPPPDSAEQDLTPDEKARREKVRAAARERQKKHRALVKQRKLRELGLDMGNEIPEVQYRDGQYQQALAHELQHNPHGVMVQHEPPFPQGQLIGGQMFASTLLLSFSCAPLLKQHLMRNLQMTNEELTSLEPIIADAWEHWDHQVCSFANIRRSTLYSYSLLCSVECITRNKRLMQRKPPVPYLALHPPTLP
jgi:hypothetical protein